MSVERLSPDDARSSPWLLLGLATSYLVYDPSALAAQPKRLILLLLAILLLVPLALTHTGTQRRPSRWSLGWLGAAAFVLSMAVSLSWSPTLRLGTLLTWCAALGVGLSLMPWPRGRVRLLCEELGVWVGGALGSVAFLQWALGARGVAVHAGQGNANWLGTSLGLTLPLSVGALCRARSRGSRVAMLGHGVALVAQLMGLVLSGSRVAWVALVVTGVVLGSLWALELRRKNRAAHPGSLSTLSVASLPALLFAASLAAAWLPKSNSRAEHEAMASLAGRFHIWRASVEAAHEALPWGHGLGSFGAAFLDAQGEQLGGLPLPAVTQRWVNATTAHNDYLQFLVEGGLLGLALFLVLMGFVARNLWREQWTAGLGAWVALLVMCSAESPLAQPGCVLILAVLLVAAEPPEGSFLREGGRRPGSVLRKVSERHVVWLLLPVLSLMAFFAMRGWLATRSATRAEELHGRERLARLEHAASLDPHSGEIALSVGLARLEQGDAEGALEALDASRAYLASLGAEIARGNALMQLNRPREAVRAYTRALTWHPASLKAWVNRGVAALQLGELASARQCVDRVRKVWPGHPRVRELEEKVAHAERESASGNLEY